MFQEPSMTAPNLILSEFHENMMPNKRVWQGIPSMEITKEGIIFAVFYSGGAGEECGNFLVLARRKRNADTWEEPCAIVVHPDKKVRCFDSNLWIDPLGRLWLTWAQSLDHFDGRCGVWAAICDNPSADDLLFGEPFRIADGVMMCKPTVLKNGTWLFPCALWRVGFAGQKPSEEHNDLDSIRLSNVYSSVDNGKSFQLRGGADVPNRGVDEHMIIERNDGSLWMLVRRHDGLGESFSYDEGFTWEDSRFAGINGPDSRFFIRRLQSGNLLLINHFDFWGRNNLMAKLSLDDGKTWIGGLMIDTRKEVAYPDGCQEDNGLIHIIYDYDRYGEREILTAQFREADILAGKLVSSDAIMKQIVSKATGCKPDNEKRPI